MTSLKICMLATVGLSAAMIIKQWKSDFLPLVRLAVAVFLTQAILSASVPLIGFLKELLGGEGLSSYAGILPKALGVAILTQVCSDICRECGENGIAGGVEWMGKIEILLLSLPLIREMLALAGQLLSLGGVS
ncbi:MAG: hypothetical protein IIX80_04360 [Clostridia bacterium]|nr:hypothetical protein [Clostridia bacterium]